jgi:hypothetical protein
MKGYKWLRVAFVIAAAIAVHAFGGSAQAASIGARSFATARVATAGGSSGSNIVLAGFTSQQYPAFFKISADAKTLRLSGIALAMSCTSGAQFILQDSFARVPISPSGKLHIAVAIPSTSGSSGVTYSGSDSVTARLGSRHTELSGTWQLHVNYSYTNGMTDQCDSGPVRFTATG